AIASTSARVPPAVARARSTAGTIASRWARLATSGTTPPNRACWSTLEATASASSSLPRTRPAPVSSQEVSMPRTSGPLLTGHRRFLVQAVQAAAHHDRVRAGRLVVAAADADVLEAEPAVEVLGARVVRPHLQEHLGAVPAPGL